MLRFPLRTIVTTVLTAIPILSVQPHSDDIRLRLLADAEQSDQDFPDGKSVMLTHFGYVGSLVTSEGLVYVVDRRSVLTRMLSPRGLNYITFFDAQERYLGKIYYGLSRPLWCEGGKLYLWGGIDLVEGSGNVVDLSAGFRNLAVRHESAYGSSGGISD